MTRPQDDMLIPGAAEASFADVERALASPERADGGPMPALTGTLIVVGSRDRLAGCESVLSLAESIGLRTILISTTAGTDQRILLAGRAVALEGLPARFVDNAIAAMRLSSLPSIAWWRGGEPTELDELAAVADRLVLDAEDPFPGWARVPALAARTPVGDARWVALTRWRALMADFFDVPEVARAAPSLRRLEVSGSDRPSMQLFAAWVSASLGWHGQGTIALVDEPGPPMFHGATLADGDQRLVLRVHPGHACVDTLMEVRGHARASRTVALGDQGMAALLAQELRIRARDRAFEAALAELHATGRT